MSIEKLNRKRKGTGYKVWYRDQSGRGRAKVFDRKKDAEAFEAKITLMKRQGDLDDLDAGKQTLADFTEKWWARYAERSLERKTLQVYATLWDLHILPRLGDRQLRSLKPALIEAFAADLKDSRVGEATIRKSLALLQVALGRAVVWGKIPDNPVSAVKKPPQHRKRSVRPLAPENIEAIRRDLLERSRLRDATLVSLLAYTGMRPGEALALTWGDIGAETIVVDKRLSLGEVKDGAKSRARARRSVELLKPLAQDLAEWRMTQGRPGPEQLVFPATKGGPWKDTDYRNWRKRIFAPATEKADLKGVRPYDLRHSYASLLIAEGRSIVEIAAQLGHSPTVCLDTYGHVFAELKSKDATSAEELIRNARARTVNFPSTKSEDEEPRKHESPANDRSPLADSNRRPPPWSAERGSVVSSSCLGA